MKAVVYYRPEHYELTDLPDPQPGAGEVRLRMRAAGICGTDVHLHHGEFSPRYPFTPGHEIVGEVETLGDEVDGVRTGQLVALDNRIACGTCANCRRAKPAFCTRLRDLGVTDPGGFAEYVVAPAGKCHPVDGLSPDLAVLAEPTACAMHGMDVLAAQPGSDVLVFGAGTSGLLLIQLLRHSGAGRLTVAAPTPFKLDLARELGADETVLLDRTDPASAMVRLRDLAPDGFDIVVDATGAIGVLRQCVPLARDGGTVFCYGMAPEQEQLTIRPYEIFRRELTVKGSFAQAFSFDRALRALRTGRVRGDSMVTHHFDLGSYATALDTVAHDHACIKAVLHP